MDSTNVKSVVSDVPLTKRELQQKRVEEKAEEFRKEVSQAREAYDLNKAKKDDKRKRRKDELEGRAAQAQLAEKKRVRVKSLLSKLKTFKSAKTI
jgi:hypothetical protein